MYLDWARKVPWEYTARAVLVVFSTPCATRGEHLHLITSEWICDEDSEALEVEDSLLELHNAQPRKPIREYLDYEDRYQHGA